MKRRVIIIPVSALLGFAFVPFPSRATPKVVIRVLDDSGIPISGVAVYRNWEHFGFHQSASSHARTGPTGEAVFAAQSAWGSLSSRASAPLKALFPHTSFGSRTHIEIYPPGGYELRLAQPDFTPI